MFTLENYKNFNGKIDQLVHELNVCMDELDIKKDKLINIGTFSSAMKFHGYNRCDLHPRWSPDGNYISIDSTHQGKRKTYIIDVSKIMI